MKIKLEIIQNMKNRTSDLLNLNICILSMKYIKKKLYPNKSTDIPDIITLNNSFVKTDRTSNIATISRTMLLS